MNPLLPAQLRADSPAWAQTVVAFLAEKERRSGSRRTGEGYARMLWPFFGRVGSPNHVTPAHVLAWAHGIGVSGREAGIGHRWRPDRLPQLLLPVPNPDERHRIEPVRRTRTAAVHPIGRGVSPRVVGFERGS
jgi:hypothetical protein